MLIKSCNAAVFTGNTSYGCGGYIRITNMAAGVLPQKLNHREVVETAALVHDKFRKLLTLVIDLLD